MMIAEAADIANKRDESMGIPGVVVGSVGERFVAALIGVITPLVILVDKH